MPEIPLKKIVEHCDKILRTRDIGDYDGAANGLQVRKFRRRHTHRRHRGRKPCHGKTRGCRQGGFADCPSRIVLDVRASRGRAKNTNCSGCSRKIIWPFTARICRSMRIPGLATTRSFAPRSV